jgi:hypothetical protein
MKDPTIKDLSIDQRNALIGRRDLRSMEAIVGLIDAERSKGGQDGRTGRNDKVLHRLNPPSSSELRLALIVPTTGSRDHCLVRHSARKRAPTIGFLDAKRTT